MFTGREFSKESESFYWSVLRKNGLEDTEENRLLFHRGFYLGAQYAMRTSAELSPHLARFMEFVMWLTEKSE
jgi:hypothetical protein